MGSGLAQLVRLLPPGRWCSGEQLARSLKISRAAVWKQIERARELGLPIRAERGRGYRLDLPLELLSEPRMRDFGGAELATLQQLEVVFETGSTNADLLALPPSQAHARARFAERQTAGRGRRGRRWHAALGRSLCFSLGWRFEAGLGALAFLPLVTAIAVAEALEELGLADHSIKWPNDIVVHPDKLAGCLLEVRGDVSGPCLAVLGVGLNIALDDEPGALIDQPWTDLQQQGLRLSRNHVAGALLTRLIGAVQQYDRDGFAPFEDAWKRWDGLSGKTVMVRAEDGTERSGVARGLGSRGGLLVHFADGERECLAGEVSVRGG